MFNLEVELYLQAHCEEGQGLKQEAPQDGALREVFLMSEVPLYMCFLCARYPCMFRRTAKKNKAWSKKLDKMERREKRLSRGKRIGGVGSKFGGGPGVRVIKPGVGVMNWGFGRQSELGVGLRG